MERSVICIRVNSPCYALVALPLKYTSLYFHVAYYRTGKARPVPGRRSLR